MRKTALEIVKRNFVPLNDKGKRKAFIAEVAEKYNLSKRQVGRAYYFLFKRETKRRQK